MRATSRASGSQTRKRVSKQRQPAHGSRTTRATLTWDQAAAKHASWKAGFEAVLKQIHPDMEFSPGGLQSIQRFTRNTAQALLKAVAQKRAADHASLRASLVEHYSLYDSSKVPYVDIVLQHYAGRPMELHDMMREERESAQPAGRAEAADTETEDNDAEENAGNEMQQAARTVLPFDLALHYCRESTQALAKYNTSRQPNTETSMMGIGRFFLSKEKPKDPNLRAAGLKFAWQDVQTIALQSSDVVLENDTAVTLAAILEALAAEIIECSCNASATENNETRIVHARHVQTAVSQDEELNALQLTWTAKRHDSKRRRSRFSA